MDLFFLINAVFSTLSLAALGALNLGMRERLSLQRRMGALGFLLAGVIGLFSAAHLGFLPWNDVSFGAMLCLGWMSALEYLSCLIDMTSARRPPLFRFAFFLPPLLAVLTVVFFSQVTLIVLVALGALVLCWFTMRWLRAWIAGATDDRSRRDGQWMLLVFGSFAVGSLLCALFSLRGLFALVVIWYLVMYIVINKMKIFSQVSDLENQLIMDNVFDIVMILDSSGCIVRLNRRGFQITGVQPQAVYGKGIENFVIHGELQGGSRKEWLERYGSRESFSGMSRTPSFDAHIVTGSGEEIPVDLRIICLVDLSRRKTGYIVSATDMRITHQLMKEISDREYATRDLAVSESKFSRMFIFNPTGILIVDLESRLITDANPAMEEILDRETSSITGKTLEEIGLEMSDPTIDALIERIQMEGSVSEFDANIRFGPHTVRKCRLSAVSFDLNRTRSMLVSVADVTQQETMREALNRKQKVETIGILAGGIAHDFNNILAVILGHIGLAKMRIVDDHAREPVVKAEHACLRAREMTRQLLAFSRGGKPVMSLCQPRQIIIDAAMLAVSDSSVACLFNISQEIWQVNADRIQISQVITNLVGNAVDAMERSGMIEIQAKNADFRNCTALRRLQGLDGQPLPPAPFVEIRIHDEGPGIPEEIRSKIFDPFFTTKEKGTGLGLAIVYSVIQNHGGTVRIESRKGEGTTFIVYLPAIPDAPQAETETGPVCVTGKKRVLLMDDDLEVRETASGLLESFGFEVVATSDGKEATDTYRDALVTGVKFDFCILDLVIPGGMSGIDCARGILALDQSSVLLVSSGYSDDPVLSHYRDYGFVGIIPKPYTREEMQQVLRRVLVL